MNHLRLRTCDWTQRLKPLRRTTREISRTSNLYTRPLVQRKLAHEFNCTGTAKTIDIEVAEQKVISYVTRRPSSNMSQLLLNTGKGIQRKQIQSKGERLESLLLRGCYRHAHARAQICAVVMKQQGYDGGRVTADRAYA